MTIFLAKNIMYLYKGVVYYGTGYKYKSWFGDKYIPRPNTYGYGARKKSSGGSSNVRFYAGVGMGGPMMGMGWGGYPYGYGLGWGGWGWGGYNMWSQMAYNQYYYAGQKVMIDHDVVEEQPIDLQNIYNNRVEGIVVTETARRNDPMKPVILDNKQAVPNDLYVDENGQIFRRDDSGTWYQQKAGDWVRSEKTFND